MRKLNIVIILIGFAVFSMKSNACSTVELPKSILTDSTQKTVVDPVCKMTISPKGAKTSVYKKVTYYFCSESCKQKFMAAPAKYVKK